VAACSLVEVQLRFATTSCLHIQCRTSASSLFLTGCLFGVLFGLEDGYSTFIRNVGKFLPEYSASHRRRQQFS
jgi:hypothetical protein